MDLIQSKSAFLEFLATQKGYSPHTLRAYDLDLSHWLGELARKSDIRDLEGLSRGLQPAHLRSYLSGLYETHERTSLCRRLAAIRSFLKFLRKREWIRRDIGLLVPSPKAKRELPRFLKIEEASELIEAP